MSELLKELADVATQLAPEIIGSLVNLAKLALRRAPKDEILSEAEKLATLTAFKASYRRGSQP